MPSRYLDASDSSASSRTRNTSSLETGHNSAERVETPKGPPPIHYIMDPSPWYQQRSMEGASIIQRETETTIGNCESSSKMDCRKRAERPATFMYPGYDVYLDDDFFEGLGLDAIKA
jgi:fanconi anemia group M protein